MLCNAWGFKVTHRMCHNGGRSSHVLCFKETEMNDKESNQGRVSWIGWLFQLCGHFCWVHRICHPSGIEVPVIYQENTSVFTLVTQGGGVMRTKHLRARMNRVIEAVQECRVEIGYMPAKHKVVDGFFLTYPTCQHRTCGRSFSITSMWN